MKPKLPVKLDLSYRASNGDASTFDWSEVPEGVLPYEEIDFSYNGITSAELDRVLEVCSRCPKLRVLKLFKNSIDDSGAEGLAELCRQSPKIEEIHLSHNMFTAEGASVIIIAAEACRQPDTVPLWLRLEQNHIDDAENVFRRLQDRYSVCRRIDPKACTSRTCVKKCLVHLPHFCLQRLSHVDSHPDLPQLAKSGATNGNNGNHALPRQMMRQFREDLDRQKGKSKGKSEPLERVALAERAKIDFEKPRPMQRAVSDEVAPEGGRPPQIQVEQLVDPEGAQEFFCYLCHGVLYLPMLTRCSHLFCSPCFQSWVMDRVNEHQTGPASQQSMQAMPCPICENGLKKADVVPLHRAQHPAAGILQRQWHSIKLKCIHHIDFTNAMRGASPLRPPFAEPACRMREPGVECQWVGDLPDYAAHCKVCPVAAALRTPTENEGAGSFYEDDICVAKYDFDGGENPKLLRINAKDMVKIYRTVPSGWAGGILLDKCMEEVGLPGWFPIKYVELYKDKENIP